MINYKPGDIIQCIKICGIGKLTIGKKYEVFKFDRHYHDCFKDDQSSTFHLRNTFNDCFKIVKKEKFHK